MRKEICYSLLRATAQKRNNIINIMEKYFLIAILGKSGSGKDTFVKHLMDRPCSKMLHKKISHTTRPQRDYEKDGVDYFFKTPDYFLKHLDDFFEVTCFNNWYYGTQYSSLNKNKINIGIFTPDGLEAIKESKDIRCISIYIDCKNKLRLIRALNREENPDIEEIFRRYKADELDFEYIKDDVDIILGNNNLEELEYSLEFIEKLIKIIYEEGVNNDKDY